MYVSFFLNVCFLSNSVVEYLPTMYKILSLIPSTTKKIVKVGD
jgi:hypothetical protein